ncbi:Transmembrane protein 70 homolog, mitochondrial [Anthophora quadrimaculata]
MVLLLRSCVLIGRKLFTQEVSFKHFVTFPKYSNNLKKFVPSLQVKYFSVDKDNVQKRELVYTGDLWKQIRNIKILSIISTIMSICGQPMLFMKMINNDNLVSLGIIFAFGNIILIGSPILIYLVTKRYVINLYHCPQENTYVAVVYRFFLQRKEITFTPNDIKPPKMFKGSLTTCIAKDNPLYMDSNQFINLKHYNIIMGYNKPSDFEVEPVNIAPINRFPIVNQNLQIENKVKKEN